MLICDNFNKIYKYEGEFKNCNLYIDSTNIDYGIVGLMPSNGKFIMVLFSAEPDIVIAQDFSDKFILTFNLKGEFISGYFCGGFHEIYKNKKNLTFVYHYSYFLNTNTPSQRNCLIWYVPHKTDIIDVSINKVNLIIDDTGKLVISSKNELVHKKNLDVSKGYPEWDDITGDSLMYYLRKK